MDLLTKLVEKWRGEAKGIDRAEYKNERSKALASVAAASRIDCAAALEVRLAALRPVIEKLVEADNGMQDAAEMLWVVLANVSGGDWAKQNDEWQKAAARWRDNYFKALTGSKAALESWRVENEGK